MYFDDVTRGGIRYNIPVEKCLQVNYVVGCLNGLLKVPSIRRFLTDNFPANDFVHYIQKGLLT